VTPSVIFRTVASRSQGLALRAFVEFGAGRPTARALGVVAVLLTFASGASDVASFTRLGNVFTSVMTGNMAVFGLSLARGSLSLALHTLLAVCGYVLGVVAGTRLLWFRAKPGTRDRGSGDAGRGDDWPRLRLALAAEFVLYLGVLIGWEATGAQPSGVPQYVLLALAAGAMGIQSAAVNQMGLGNVSTTYLTGTLTGLVSAIARRDSKPVGWRRQSVLLGLLAGATLAGLCVAYAAAVVPLLPLLMIGTTAVLLSRRPLRAFGALFSCPRVAPHVARVRECGR
jgi:uncharacterized membrane protein YoaK (UPF0700 family)